MTLAELQRALTSVEPAAVLVPPRVIESIIRQVLNLSGMVWSVPHSRSCNVERTLLFRHVDQADLVLAPDQILPANVILLSWPSEEELQRAPRADILLQTWRQLFHAVVHQAVDRCWDDAILSAARLREHIEAIGPTAFEEIQTVLRQENILAADADDRATFNEFAAVFLELFHFSPTLIPSFFPGLGQPEATKTLLDQDLGSDAILRRTRLPGAPDPIVTKDNVAFEANEYFHELEVSSQKALDAGNMVEAAIQLQRAVRVAPADQAPQAYRRAEGILERLLERLKAALELSDEECVGWSRLLPILLDKADQGSRPAEAALLQELQNICLDHEREMYKLDVVEYVLSAGRRPLRRPLPSQRLVRITRTLRGAMPNLTAARLSDKDRGDLDALLQNALHRAEERVRARFRPIITAALQDVGLAAHNPLETVAFRKMVEELLDRVIAFGFLTFSDLRDTISRNQLKLADLTDPQDFIRGDSLIRLDRRLATTLDGVYRPGEFYLRWLERFTALQFGTKLGRLFTRYITLPVGGGFLIVFALIRIFHLRGPEPTLNEANQPLREIGEITPETVAAGVAEAADTSWAFFDWINISLWIGFSIIIFGLIHSPQLREKLVLGVRAFGRTLRAAFVQFPLWIAHHATLDKLLTSTPTKLLYWYVLKPGILTLIAVCLVERLREVWYEVVLCFLASNFIINSRPGEVIGQSFVAMVQKFVTLVRAGLIPGLIVFIERIYKQVIHSIEGALFKVDEWLRFRSGESEGQIFLRSIGTLLWMPISYLARFNLVVLIEPCFHPLKFPVVTVATKFYIPFVPMIRSFLTSWIEPVFGQWLTFPLVWWLIFWGPDVFGFIFWEMKENWSLFRANRRQTIGAMPIGRYGETIRGFFQPGFHSGTLPKVFAKIRHAEARALHTGNFSAVRHYRASMQEIEESLLKFAARELAALLEQSAVFRSQALTATSVKLSSNRIRFQFAHPNFPDQPLEVTFENRASWIVVGLNDPPWIASLSAEAQAELHNALALFYKLGGVDLVREQIRATLPSPADQFDFTPRGLIIYPAERDGKPLSVNLRGELDPKELPDPTVSILTWDPERVLFSERTLTRDECLASWPRTPALGVSPRLLADVPILPTPAKADERESAA